MKKILSLVLCLVLAAALCLPAAAETDLSAYNIANGSVQAASFEDITAPYSGTLLPFDHEIGDAVSAGETLFTLRTADITAPEDGTVRRVFAEAGDSADAVMSTYGSVLALEPASQLRVRGTYAGAYNREKNRHVHVGDTLYFRLNGKNGTCVVIAAGEGGYEAEVTSGSFRSGRNVDLFLNSKRRSEDKVGVGRTYYRDDLPVPAAGRVAEILVAPGDTVKKGDVLLRVMAPDADAGASPDVTALSAGVVGLLGVSPGEQVWKGRLLCRLLHSDDPEIVAQVDEMDLGGLRVGDTLPVTLDTDESRVLTGTVTGISALGVTRQNAAYYTVHLTVEGAELMLGQSASVYLPKK